MAHNLNGPWAELSDIAAIVARLSPERLRSNAMKALECVSPSLSIIAGEMDLRVFGVQSGFFYYPLAQWVEWGSPSEEELESLGTALALGHIHYALQDDVIDEGRATCGSELLSEVALLMYLDALAAIVDEPMHKLTRRHLSYFALYCDAQLVDQEHRRTRRRYDSHEICRLGHKSAPIALVLESIATRCSSDAGSASVDGLFDLCCGLQLVDDYADICHDLMTNQATPVSTELSSRTQLSPDSLKRIINTPSGELDVSVLSLLSGVSEGTLSLAVRYFDRAMHSSEHARLSTLSDIARQRSRLVSQLVGECRDARAGLIDRMERRKR